MKTFGLGKPHKLCSKTDIDALFARRDGVSNAILAYPLRAVWSLDTTCAGNTDSPADGTSPGSRPTVRFLISVPKKKLRHAVDRVQMRRRIREAYRLQRPGLVPSHGTAPPVNVAFIYVAHHLEHYGRVERSMQRILKRIFPTMHDS